MEMYHQLVGLSDWNILEHFSTLLSNLADDRLIFFNFFIEVGFDISCNLSSKETICMKCQTLFSGKKIRKIFQNFVSKFLPYILNPCMIFVPLLSVMTHFHMVS